MAFCAKCGKEIVDSAVVCPHCGVPVQQASQTTAQVENPNSKSFIATLLLCLFLGGFGAHRFYLGRPGTAILMLILTLTCFGAVISGIWVIIDLIRICTGSLKPANGSNLTN